MNVNTDGGDVELAKKSDGHGHGDVKASDPA